MTIVADVKPLAFGPQSSLFAVADAPPDARDDAIAIHEDALYSGSVFADHGFGIDSDPEGEALRVAAVEGQASYVGLGFDLAAGRVRVMSDGRFWFDTADDFDYLRAGESVQVSFDYTIADAAGQTDTATVTMTIAGRDDAPVLREDTIYSHERAVTSGNVFADNGHGRDLDPDGDKLTVTKFLGSTTAAGELAELPGGGKVRLMADGRFWFVAGEDFDDLKPGEFRDTSFTYRATDGDFTRVSTVTVRVEGVDSPPVAPDFDFATDEDRTLYTTVLGFGKYGYDPEGEDVSVLSVNGVKANVGVSIDLDGGGRLRMLEDGHFWFNPDGDFDDLAEGESRDVTVSYTLTDGTRPSAPAEITFTVRGVDGGVVDETDYPPVAVDDRFVFSLSGAMTGNFFADNGFGPDYDPNPGDELQFFIFSPGPDDGYSMWGRDSTTRLGLDDGGRIILQPNGDFEIEASYGGSAIQAGDHLEMHYSLGYQTEWEVKHTSSATVEIDFIA